MTCQRHSSVSRESEAAKAYFILRLFLMIVVSDSPNHPHFISRLHTENTSIISFNMGIGRRYWFMLTVILCSFYANSHFRSWGDYPEHDKWGPHKVSFMSSQRCNSRY